MNDIVILAEATKTGSHNICPYTIKTKSEYNGSMMKTIREFLEEQINEQLIQAVVSGRRTGEGPSKVKLRPVELKGQIFYQASMTEGTKVYHKNFTREEMIAYLEHAMEEFRQLQATGRSQDGSILISKKGKATIKTKTTRACTE